MTLCRVRYKGSRATRKDVAEVTGYANPEDIGGCQRGTIGIYNELGRYITGYSVLAWFKCQNGIAGGIQTVREPRIYDEETAGAKLGRRPLELMLDLDKNANVPINIGLPGSVFDPEQCRVVTIEHVLLADGGFLELKKRRARFKDYQKIIESRPHGG